MEKVILTVTKEGATKAELDAVVARLQRGLPVETSMGGSLLVGRVEQESKPVAINYVGQALTVAVRERHGEQGLIVAAVMAAVLKVELVGADGASMPANASTVTRLLGRALTEKGEVLAETLGLVLPDQARQPVCAILRGGNDMRNEISGWEFCNPFFLLMCVLFVIPALCYVLVVELVKGAVGYYQRRQSAAQQQAAKVVVAAQPVIQAAMQPVAGPTQSAVPSRPAVASQTSATLWAIQPEIALSEIGRVELPKGYVVFRFYKQQGVAKGRFTATAKTLQRAGVKTVALEVVCQNIAEAHAVMKQKAEDIVASAKSPSRKAKASGQVEPTPTANEPQGDSGVPDYLRAEDEAMFSGQPLGPEPESLCSEPYVDPETPPHVAPRHQATPAKDPSLVYRGVLRSHGLESRKLTDPVKGDRFVKHFCVRIYDETLQAEQPLWGNDLQRAIEESGAAVGDRVELGLIGETPVLVKGKTKKKKVWSLIKLS